MSSFLFLFSFVCMYVLDYLLHSPYVPLLYLYLLTYPVSRQYQTQEGFIVPSALHCFSITPHFLSSVFLRGTFLPSGFYLAFYLIYSPFPPAGSTLRSPKPPTNLGSVVFFFSCVTLSPPFLFGFSITLPFEGALPGSSLLSSCVSHFYIKVPFFATCNKLLSARFVSHYKVPHFRALLLFPLCRNHTAITFYLFPPIRPSSFLSCTFFFLFKPTFNACSRQSFLFNPPFPPGSQRLP